MHLRHPVARHFERVQHLGGPTALADVEEGGAGSIGDLSVELAGQPEADVILGQQHLPDLSVGLRLILPDPDDFGRREAGQHRVRCQLDDPLPTDALRDPRALRAGALVAPEERRAQHLMPRVQEDRAVHLPRETDAPDLPRGDAAFRQRLPDRENTGPPPILRLLLRPARPRRAERILGGRRAEGAPLLIDDECPGSRRPDVNAQQRHGRSSRGWGLGVGS